MAKGNSMPAIGAWAFLGGLVIAFIAGLLGMTDPTVALVLGILGLIVGFLNIGDKEVGHFLVAGIAWLVSASSLSTIGLVLLGPNGIWIASVFNNVSIFVAPAVAIVGLKAVYDISKD